MYVIIIIACIILIIGSLCFLSDGELLGIIPFIIGAIGLIQLAFNPLYYDEKAQIIPQIEQPKHIDLPEEWDQISNKQLKPDTMISYLKHDTLFIRFKGHN